MYLASARGKRLLPTCRSGNLYEVFTENNVEIKEVKCVRINYKEKKHIRSCHIVLNVRRQD